MATARQGEPADLSAFAGINPVLGA